MNNYDTSSLLICDKLTLDNLTPIDIPLQLDKPLNLQTKELIFKEDNVCITEKKIRSWKKMSGNYDIKLMKIEQISKGDLDNVEDEDGNLYNIFEEHKSKVIPEFKIPLDDSIINAKDCNQEPISISKLIVAPEIGTIKVTNKIEKSSSVKRITITPKANSSENKIDLFKDIPNSLKTRKPGSVNRIVKKRNKRETKFEHKKKIENNNDPNKLQEKAKSHSKIHQQTKFIPKMIPKESQSNLEVFNDISGLLCETRMTSESVIIPSENSSFNYTPSVVKLDLQMQLDAQLITSLARASQCIREKRRAKKNGNYPTPIISNRSKNTSSGVNEAGAVFSSRQFDNIVI